MHKCIDNKPENEAEDSGSNTYADKDAIDSAISKSIIKSDTDSKQTSPDTLLDYWKAAEEHINDLLASKKITPYEAEAFIWSHRRTSEIDAFLNSLPENLRKKKYFHKNKPALAIAAKSSNTFMTVTCALFTCTSAIASFLLAVFPLSPLINLISNLINNVAWDGSDSLFSFVISADLIKNSVWIDAVANAMVSILLLPATIAYLLTLPTAIQVITNVLASMVTNIGLNIIFAVSMWVSCFVELHHVSRGNKLIADKQAELDSLQKELHTLKNSNKADPIKIVAAQNKIIMLENFITFHKHQVRIHKKNAWLWSASATLITGSAVLTTLMVLGIVASGAATLGIVPGILGLACAVFAVWRWHLNKYAKINLDTPKPASNETTSTRPPSQASLTSHIETSNTGLSQRDSLASNQMPDPIIAREITLARSSSQASLLNRFSITNTGLSQRHSLASNQSDDSTASDITTLKASFA